MKYCNHCGNELLDEAVVCTKCGCAVSVTTPVMQPSKKPVSKKTIILSCIGGFVLILAIFIAAVLIRTDVKIDDLSAKPNKISALLKFGIPTNGFSSDDWLYRECITIQGIEIDGFYVNFDDDTYDIFVFDDTSEAEIEELLTDECSSEWSKMGSFFTIYCE